MLSYPGAGGIHFVLRYHLHTYFVYASSVGVSSIQRVKPASAFLCMWHLCKNLLYTHMLSYPGTGGIHIVLRYDLPTYFVYASIVGSGVTM